MSMFVLKPSISAHLPPVLQSYYSYTDLICSSWVLYQYHERVFLPLLLLSSCDDTTKNWMWYTSAEEAYNLLCYDGQVLSGVIRANRRREARAAIQALERANKVHMMRHYRTGRTCFSELDWKWCWSFADCWKICVTQDTWTRLFLSVTYDLEPFCN